MRSKKRFEIGEEATADDRLLILLLCRHVFPIRQIYLVYKYCDTPPNSPHHYPQFLWPSCARPLYYMRIYNIIVARDRVVAVVRARFLRRILLYDIILYNNTIYNNHYMAHIVYLLLYMFVVMIFTFPNRIKSSSCMFYHLSTNRLT